MTPGLHRRLNNREMVLLHGDTMSFLLSRSHGNMALLILMYRMGLQFAPATGTATKAPISLLLPEASFEAVMTPLHMHPPRLHLVNWLQVLCVFPWVATTTYILLWLRIPLSCPT